MITLPPSAAAHLQALEARASDARALASAAKSRREAIEKELDLLTYSHRTPPNIEAQRQLLSDRLDLATKQVAERTKEEREVGQLVRRITDFLDALPRDSVIEEVAPPKVDPAHDPIAQLVLIRNKLASLKKERKTLEVAPLHPEDAKQHIQLWVADQAKKAAPHINTRRQFSIEFPQTKAEVMGTGSYMSAFTVDPVGVFAWLFPDALAAALEREAEKNGRDNVLPLKVRKQRLAELDKQLRETELVEEMVVRAVETQGLPVFRRVDAEPTAVLMITITKNRAAPAAKEIAA